jgi:hypothetical protein
MHLIFTYYECPHPIIISIDNLIFKLKWLSTIDIFYLSDKFSAFHNDLFNLNSFLKLKKFSGET